MLKIIIMLSSNYIANNLSSKQSRKNQPPVGERGPIRRRICVASINKQLYNLRAVIIIHAMTQIVKSFRGGGLGEVPFSKGASPSKLNQPRTNKINVSAQAHHRVGGGYVERDVRGE